ncbi:protein mono-ADP-ribosyltransferase PARP14-like [Alosa pseudoharengus]|uniref:protein mono-ADP-ribosyltransferase PARP14-like n=1 Tax=Alosa pseudoharengus TaxID=34774 RepID=UPI003F8B4A51
MDPYLLGYLKENPKAGQDLKQCLSPLCSSFEIFQEAEEIVVKRGTAQDALRQEKWEMQLEDVFFKIRQTYDCYYEVDPKILKILQDKISLCSGNVCIYKENEELGVVVGEKCEVAKLFQMLEDLQIKRQVCEDSMATEVQFSLVEEEFGREIKISSPHVKLTRQGSRTPVFEGPEAEVEAACATLQELVKKIRQRRLQLPAPLLAFLTSSGAIQTYQTRFQQSLRSPVMLEVGPDLVLSSLTTEALEEAAAALERDLTVETVVLEQAESPGMADLRETLNHALQQANHNIPKVKLSYGAPSQSDPRMPVQLVGYRQDVERLRQVLLNYKLNQADISDFLNLPNSFVVDHFLSVLELLGIQYNGLRIMPIHLPCPSVQFAGPRQLVQEFRKRLTSGIGSLITKDFNVEGPGALQYFRGEGKDNIALLEGSHKVRVLLSSDQSQVGATASQSASAVSITLTDIQPDPSLTPPDYSRNKIHLEVVLGQLEVQQVDVMVGPMMKKTLTATRIGNAFAQKAGDQFQRNFDRSRKCQNSLKPGDVLEVDGTSALGCQKVFFIECLPWDALKGNSEKALRYGLKRTLELCEHHAFSSMAFPIIGPGLVLSIPAREAAQILADEIGRFGKLGPTRSLSTIQIVIQPDYPDSTEVFQEVCWKLSTYMVDINTGQAIFQSLTSDLDEITLPVGGIQLHLVFGDITNETTDVVVNTTDFQNFDTTVCKDILTLAGPDVKRSLQSAQVNRGEIFTSPSGSFPCKAIMHVCGQKDPAVIQDLARDILLLCERKRYQSVAIPAICAGTGGVNPRLVADAILNGVKAVVSSHTLQYLSTIRVVLLKVNVFQHFHAAAQAIMGVPATPTTPGHLRAIRVPVQQSPPQSLKPDLSSLLPSPRVCPLAAFTLLGTSAQDVSNACAGLQRAYNSHCSKQTLAPEELAGLSHAELQDLVGRVNSLGVQLEPSGPGSGAEVVVRGLNEGVNEVMYVMQGALRRQVVERDQRELFNNVVWCIMGQRGDWERFPKEANQKLEKGDISSGVMDAHGCCWKVDLRQMRATATGLGRAADIKRLQNLRDFRVPVYWDTLHAHGALQVVPLEPSSAEYDRVKRDFKKTAKKTVLKIERVQNVHLRRAFEVQRQQLEDKNGAPVGPGEKMLYHGTTAQACQSIMKTGFNRGFAGQNATVYGLGTYFAVNARYSADPTYSRPEADGTQLMFVARVLTGLYTLGQSDMKVPPPVSPQQPDIRFDSLVDNQQNPSMFVVFHDSQAYPDCLITFK